MLLVPEKRRRQKARLNCYLTLIVYTLHIPVHDFSGADIHLKLILHHIMVKFDLVDLAAGVALLMDAAPGDLPVPQTGLMYG